MSMPNLQEWLNRKRSGPKPKKRLPVMSAKRRRESREYSAKRKDFLARHPYCEGWRKIVMWMIDNDHEALETAPLDCPRSTDVHHGHRRGVNYLNEATWLAVSRWGHEWIHHHPKAARELGLLK